MKNLSTIIKTTQLLVALVVLVACGSKENTIRSGSFNATQLGSFNAYRAVSTDTQLSFCVSRIRLENEAGEAQGGDGNGEINLGPIFVEVGDGAAKDWASVKLPSDFNLSRIKVKAAKNEACGVNYAFKVNSIETQEEVEFTWRLDSPRALKSGEAIELHLETLVDALASAAQSGSLNVESLKSVLESVEDTFELQEN